MLQGVGTLWSRGVTSTLRPGDLVLIPPDDVHTGGLDERAGVLSYTALHVPPELVALAAEGKPRSNVARSDVSLARALRQVDAATSVGDALSAEGGIVAAIDLLAGRTGSPGSASDRGSRAEPAFVRLAREVIDDCHADITRVSLGSLARLAAVSPFHLAREFKRALGLAPHQYVIQARIRRAARLLAEGLPISDTAITVGFTDQSHLTAHFKRHVGITPASWQRANRGRGHSLPGPGENSTT
jgi:AraC-like DNA-binding protein